MPLLRLEMQALTAADCRADEAWIAEVPTVVLSHYEASVITEERMRATARLRGAVLTSCVNLFTASCRFCFTCSYLAS